jgi:hypothetical protein
MATLPPDLTGPIGLELARAEEQVPGEKAMPGGSNGKNLTDRFPDVRAALASQVQVDCVLDGEMVVWTGQRMRRCKPATTATP